MENTAFKPETNTNTTNIARPKTMKLYACGGAGTNLVNRFNRSRNKEVAGFAILQTCFIDTSRSNLDPSIPEQDIYLFEDRDGSGKRRDANYDVISERHREILNRFKPADINVIVHSASGGSGSTIAQVLTNELLKRGEKVFTVIIGNTSSRLEVENTLKTLQGYEKMAAVRNRPVNAFYRENSADTPRGEVDADVHGTLVLMSVLFSGQNKEIDSADTKNFLDYQNVTRFEPGLTGLEIISNENQLRPGEVVFTMATLVDEATPSTPMVPTEYQSVGFLHSALKDSITTQLPLHFCTIGGAFAGVVKRLEEKMAMYEENRNSVIIKSITHGRDVGTTDDFMVF